MSGMLKSMFIFSSCVSTTAAQITVWRELYFSLCVWVSCIGFVVCLFVWIFCCCDLAIWPWSDCEVEQQYHTANKRLAIAKRIAGSSKEPEELVKSKELLRSELEAVEEAQHAAKAYTLMARLFAKVIDRVSDAVAEREVQKSIRPELVSSIGCQTLVLTGQVFQCLFLHTPSYFINLYHISIGALWHDWDVFVTCVGHEHWQRGAWRGLAWPGNLCFIHFLTMSVLTVFSQEWRVNHFAQTSTAWCVRAAFTRCGDAFGYDARGDGTHPAHRVGLQCDAGLVPAKTSLHLSGPLRLSSLILKTSHFWTVWINSCCELQN